LVSFSFQFQTLQAWNPNYNYSVLWCSTWNVVIAKVNEDLEMVIMDTKVICFSLMCIAVKILCNLVLK